MRRYGASRIDARATDLGLKPTPVLTENFMRLNRYQSGRWLLFGFDDAYHRSRQSRRHSGKCPWP
jgi:hypothetical protein